jgi:hypothetical protein
MSGMEMAAVAVAAIYAPVAVNAFAVESWNNATVI